MSKKTWIIATLGLLFGLISGGGIVYSLSPKQNSKLASLSQSSSSVGSQFSSSSASQISQIIVSSSIAAISKVQLEQNSLSQRLFGWIENDIVSTDLVFDNNKISGQFRNSTKSIKYDLTGVYLPEQTKIEFDIFENSLFSGKYEFYPQKLYKIQNQDEYNSASQQHKSENFNSSYNPAKQTNIKLIGFTTTNGFHTAEVQLFSQDEYDKFNSRTRTLIFRGIDKSTLTNKFLIPTAYFEDDGYYYFTNEVSGPVNGLTDGELVKITSRLRLSSQIHSYSKTEDIYDEQFPTNTNLFDITSIEKL